MDGGQLPARRAQRGGRVRVLGLRHPHLKRGHRALHLGQQRLRRARPRTQRAGTGAATDAGTGLMRAKQWKWVRMISLVWLN